MTEVAMFEARIRAALDRISTGVAHLVPPAAGGPAEPAAPPAPADGPAPADPAELARLRAALEEERTANAQLNERVKAIRERQEQQVATLETRVRRQQDRIAALERQGERLRQVNALLRENSAALRAAIVEGAPDAVAVDVAMQAELEATRLAQAADRAELDAILSDLLPLVNGAKANG